MMTKDLVIKINLALKGNKLCMAHNFIKIIVFF